MIAEDCSVNCISRFVRRILYFYKPTNRLFSAVETSKEDSQVFSIVGLHFIDFLLSCDHVSSVFL